MTDPADISFAKMGKEELVTLARAGELTPKRLWMAMRGASKYLKAVASGDIADDMTAAIRVELGCDQCDSCRRTESELPGVKKMWCGEPFVEMLETVLPTCGCCVGLSVNGEVVAGGKTVVRSERCPQRKW